MEDLLTPQQAADLIQVDYRTILNWIHADRLPYVDLTPDGGRRNYRVVVKKLLDFNQKRLWAKQNNN